MNRKMWLGLAMVAVSYGQLLVPTAWANQHHFVAGFILSPGVALFALGVIVLSEGIVQKVGGVSLMSLARGGPAKLVRFLVVAAFAGILVEAYARLGNLWYYAYYPTWFYWPSLVPSFIFYWVMIVESYMAGKALLDRLIRVGGRQTKEGLHYYGFEPPLYILLGIVGATLFVGGTLSAALGHYISGGYVFNPYSAVVDPTPFHYFVLAFIGLWFVCESILYARQRPSLIYTVLHGYFVPVLAIFGTSAILSLVWETQNAAVDYWVYTNWPGSDTTILGVQLSILAAWPANYFWYLLVPSALIGGWGAVFWTRPGGQRQQAKKELKDNVRQ